LKRIKTTLTTLVLSVEFYNGEEYYFKQPEIRKHVTGHLDLREFTTLQKLEVPIPFITGNPDFWFDLDFEPHLPPGLHHLTLRLDMSRAQLAYPFDTSVLLKEPSLDDSQREINYLAGARMDMTCIFEISVYLIGRLHNITSISVWQPSDPTLTWFQPQMDEFISGCRNKSITAKVIYPQIFRRCASVHWDLVEEVTLYSPSYPCSGPFGQLFRSERDGIPLGLATQYHLRESNKLRIRKHG
jgi:hypothetical protein